MLDRAGADVPVSARPQEAANAARATVVKILVTVACDTIQSPIGPNPGVPVVSAYLTSRAARTTGR